MAQYAEFNFYHGYFIPLHAVHSIVTISPFREFNMETLLQKLREGNNIMLCELQNKLPALFQSYRFINYLLNHTKPESNAMKLLEEHLNQIPEEHQNELLEMYRKSKTKSSGVPSNEEYVNSTSGYVSAPHPLGL